FTAALQEVDVIIAPTLPVMAPDIGSPTAQLNGQDGDIIDAFIRYTGPSNLTGLPALTVPVSLDDGMPIGVRNVARAVDEAAVLKVSDKIESNNTVEGRRAPIGAECAAFIKIPALRDSKAETYFALGSRPKDQNYRGTCEKACLIWL